MSTRTNYSTASGFCPILALAKLPYKFLPRVNPTIRHDVARRFFDSGKFWDRTWNVYYLDAALTGTLKPRFFVTEQTARAFVAEIDAAVTEGPIAFPDPIHHDGFVVNFDGDTPPKLLGQTANRDQFDALRSTVQSASASPLDPHLLSEQVRSLFRAVGQAGVDAPKDQRQRADQTRSSHTAGMIQLQGVKCSLGLADVGKPSSATYAFENDVIFICCDVESFEFNHNLITEIGIATLDTRHLRHSAPGAFARAWRAEIRARHFRIEEHKHLRNSKYVQGCADSFHFGRSEFVSIHDAPRAVARCFRPPFDNVTDGPDCDDATERRNIVLVGHDIKTDIAYLRKIGYDVGNLASLIDTVDTGQLWRAHARVENQPALANICYAMEIDAWNLHNAGNDAVYTLQAMLAICVCSAEGRGSP